MKKNLLDGVQPCIFPSRRRHMWRRVLPRILLLVPRGAGNRTTRDGLAAGWCSSRRSARPSSCSAHPAIYARPLYTCVGDLSGAKHGSRNGRLEGRDDTKTMIARSTSNGSLVEGLVPMHAHRQNKVRPTNPNFRGDSMQALVHGIFDRPPQPPYHGMPGMRVVSANASRHASWQIGRTEPGNEDSRKGPEVL